MLLLLLLLALTRQATITQVGRAKLTTVKTSTKEAFATSLFNTACKRSTRKYPVIPGLASTRRHESVTHNVTQPQSKHSHSPGWIEQSCRSLLRSQGAAAPTQFLQMSWCPMVRSRFGIPGGLGRVVFPVNNVTWIIILLETGKSPCKSNLRF